MTDNDPLEQLRSLAKRATADAVDDNTGLARGEAAVRRDLQLRSQREEAAQLSTQAQELVDARKAEIDRAKAELDAQMRAMEAEMAPMLEHVRGLNRAIEAGSLYLGLREQFVTIHADGQPAPVGTPITIYQSVLAMDEESRLAAVDGGMTYRDIDAFDEWLVADPSHLAQILPTPLCLVALIPRRADMFTGDFFTDIDLKEKNSQVWFLVRNGDRVYRFTATEMRIGSHLIPSPERFARFFVGTDGKPLQPGTRAWEQAEKSATAAQRQAMRIALIVQGTIDRTDLLAPAIEQGSLNLLSEAGFNDPRVRLVLDEDLAIDDGRPTWLAFQRELMNRARTGSRIVGDFRSWNFEENKEGRDHPVRKHPKYAPDPESYIAHQLARTDRVWGEDGFRFTYDRDDKVFDRDTYEYRQVKTKASYFVASTARNVIPIDEVSEAELDYYATSRRQSRDYLESLPVIRAALRVLRDEREAQQPFLDEAARRIELATGVDGERAQALAVKGLARWRTATKWTRPILDVTEARALDALTDIVATTTAELAQAGDDAHAIKTLRGRHPDAVAIYRKSDGALEVFEPQPITKPELVMASVFLRLQRYTAARLAPSGQVREWQVSSKASTAKARLLWQDPAWIAWERPSGRKAVPGAVTEPELDAAVAQILSGDDDGELNGERWRLVASATQRWSKPGHEGNLVVVLIRADVEAPTMLVERTWLLDCEGLRRSGLNDPGETLGWPRQYSGFRSDVLTAQYPTVRASPGLGTHIDKMSVLWSDQRLDQMVRDRVEREIAARRRHQELDTWWRAITMPIIRACADLVKARASAEFADVYSADERLWPRTARNQVDSAGSNEWRRVEGVLKRPSDSEFDATDMTAAELLTPEQLAAIPEQVHALVPVPRAQDVPDPAASGAAGYVMVLPPKAPPA